MSRQSNITNYFGKRKRIGADEARAAAKKILLDDGVGLERPQSGSSTWQGLTEASGNDEIHKTGDGLLDGQICIEKKNDIQPPMAGRSKTEGNVNTWEGPTAEKKLDPPRSEYASPPVKFQLLGSLSPVKKSAQLDPSQHNSSSPRRFRGEVTPVKGSAPKAKMKSSLKKLDFNKLEKNGKTIDIIKSANEMVNKIRKELVKQKKEKELPKLSKFEVLEVDVPKSPHKRMLYSPVKAERSPAKPAYQRFASLVETSNALPLPFGFQKLYELFTAVDTVCSMMVNRGETITFKKLKPAVEEMTRKNLNLRHIAQMATTFPEAFKFHVEKLRNFGSTSKVDRYELVITPLLPKREYKPKLGPMAEGENIIQRIEKMTMTPKIMKERKQFFHNALLEKTKDYHEEFLKNLEPPMNIPRGELKRWHPNFMVDHVPDIIPAELPQPPHSERPSTAKDVLERAREFLSSNVRLEKALEAASKSAEEPDSKPAVTAEVKKQIDEKLPNPLKGISKSLLEKVRAKQAAKALEAMRMTPQQEKETVMYSRLPEIARIVRTFFVNEQKRVLSWELVSEKVQFSYSRKLSKGEVEAHLKLLLKHLPEWLSIIQIRSTEYLKINQNADLQAVMEKLDKIVSEKKTI